jgi:signal peptidase
VLLAGLLFVFALPLSGWKALEVMTPSMTPAVHAGDLILVHRVKQSSLRPGQIATYTNPNRPGETITHRIIKVSNVNGVRTITTRGDANKIADQPVPAGRVVGEVTGVVPGAGRIMGLVRNPIGVLLLVIIPGLFVIFAEVGNIRRALATPEKRRAVLRRIDGLYRPAALLIIGGLAVAAGGVTFAQTISTASLTSNSFTASVSGSPTSSPTSTPLPTSSPTASPSPGTGQCANVTITNTGPSSTNVVHCTSTNVTSNSSHSSVHISNSTSQSSTTGTINIHDNTTVSGDVTPGDASNTSSNDINVSIP